MTLVEHMVEQHFREYEDRKDQDQGMPAKAAVSDHMPREPANPSDRDMAGHVEHMKHQSLENWRQEEIEKAGPMAVWDAVAQQLENLTERVDR